MHICFVFWREWPKTQIAVPGDIYNLVKTYGIAHPLIYHKGAIEKEVIGGYNIQFFLSASKKCVKAGVMNGLSGYDQRFVPLGTSVGGSKLYQEKNGKPQSVEQLEIEESDMLKYEVADSQEESKGEME